MKPPRSTLSLRRQLLLWLLLPQLVLWMVGGALAYGVAQKYAQKGIDQSLTQSLRSLSRQVKPMGSGLLIDFPRAAQDIIEVDPQDRVTYMVSSPPGSFVLGNGTLPPPPAGLLRDASASASASASAPLLYNVELDGRPMRVALMEVDYGEPRNPQLLRIQLARSLVVQQRIARELVTDMLGPLSILGVVLGLLMFAGVSRGLAPLKRLAAQLGRRSDANMASFSPIEMKQAPEEVRALAH
ncbi:MAG: sensor histidine kinase N-terminal domain-containing protein, partial [Betaproteobacteria bacterium]